MTIYEQDDWYELQEDNEQITRDQAWEEYLSTGIDPTGGELGPDFDPATGRPLSDVDDESAGAEYPLSGFDRIEAAIDAKLAKVEALERAQKAANSKPQRKASHNSKHNTPPRPTTQS